MRVVASDGAQLGIMDLREAVRKAEDIGLDLVEVAPTAVPPVCRIMDFGKYKYELSKKANEAKKHQSMILVKEVKLRPRTDVHDVQFKMKNIIRFLDEGNKVKVTIMFRGREMAHQELGRKLLDRLVKDLEAVAVVEQMIKFQSLPFPLKYNSYKFDKPLNALMLPEFDSLIIYNPITNCDVQTFRILTFSQQ